MSVSSDNLPQDLDRVHGKWLRLDNAARMYAAIMGSRSPTAFRISVATKETVDPETLQTALDEVLRRFPYFRVGLKYGMFWNFLQDIGVRPLVEKESFVPCREFSAKIPLFRIIHHGKRISAEFSHVLTDGIGGLLFTCSLVAHYFRLKGSVFDYPEGLCFPGQKTVLEETEDAYERYFPGRIPTPDKMKDAFHVPGKLIPRGDLNIITGTCCAESVLAVCRKFTVSVNDFLAAHYLWALYRSRRDSLRDIRLLVPVNMRDMYPSKTMRNFFLTVTAHVRPRLGTYTFGEILKTVNLSVRSGVDGKVMNQQIARNVGIARNPLLRVIPLFIKLPIERRIFFSQGNGPLSGIFSNLGRVILPEAVSQHIEKILFLTSPNHITKLSLGAAGFGDSITMTFSSLIESPEIPRLFFTSLRDQGIIPSIECNKETTCLTAPDAA